ncbi:hypothetical protein [Teredinibacter waterburyi]|jgi:hypothetical protein|uniref:hypothetical protein n=1 Tax=Teredinibacter waterburyi TaxID=1500538 RepID=UPI00165FEAB3|nr:hypothetical protein [Teredinibacter waterburyi]
MSSPVSRRQNIIVVITAVTVIVLSISMTLYVTGSMPGMSGGSGADGYKNVTFNDAVLTCEAETRSKFGDRIRVLTLDNHSSRYEERELVYKIFQHMDLNGKVGAPKVEFFVNCFVRASNGRVTKYEAFEEVEVPANTSSSDNTNMFGFPKK